MSAADRVRLVAAIAGLPAGERGTRIVAPQAFWEMLMYVQPARPKSSKVRKPKRKMQTRKKSKAERQFGEEPGAIRAWARENGLAVGVRGRLSARVLAAYRNAHKDDGE